MSHPHVRNIYAVRHVNVLSSKLLTAEDKKVSYRTTFRFNLHKAYLLFLWLPYPRKITSLLALLRPSLFCSTCLQLTTRPFHLPSYTSSFHLVLYLPMGRFWCKLAWCNFLVFLTTSNRCRWPDYLMPCCLMMDLTFLCNFSRPVFVLIFHWLCSITGPKIFLNIISKVISVFSSERRVYKR